MTILDRVLLGCGAFLAFTFAARWLFAALADALPAPRKPHVPLWLAFAKGLFALFYFMVATAILRVIP